MYQPDYKYILFLLAWNVTTPFYLMRKCISRAIARGMCLAVGRDPREPLEWRGK